MTNYTIYIDETGSFSFKAQKSFIGGWICKNENIKKIERVLLSSVNTFNKYLKNNNMQNINLHYPSHLHFMPLHLRHQRNGKDNSISVDPGHVSVFFEDFFSSIISSTAQVFKSTGKPTFIPNEQAGYIDILRNTLLQLIDQPDFFHHKSKINIVIAHRRNLHLYGEDGLSDWKAYEKRIKDGLTKELKEAFVGIKPSINIVFADARKEPGLIVADFFCGALRWTRNNYLEEFKVIEKFSFSNGYKRIGSRIVQQLRHLEEIDASSAAVQCADILSIDPSNKELDILLQSMLDKMSESSKSSFCSSIIGLFHDRLVDDPDRYSHLPTMNGLIKVLKTKFSKDCSTMAQHELQLIATLYLNKIRIDSHSGKTNCRGIEEFLSFLDEFGELAFDNQMLIMQQKIDAALMAVQVTSFNTFKFDDIENVIKGVRDQYLGMFKSMFKNDQVKDSNLARLEGTLGQMYGFLHDLEQDPDYFELAKLCLEKDISACLDNSSSKEQAMGYLTTLYWKNSALDKCIEQFIKESGANPASKDKIFDLNVTDPFGTRMKPFIHLHRLYICALAAQNKQNIAGLVKEKEYLLKNCRLHTYPAMLSAKWLAILLLIDDDTENAIDLLDAALIKGSSGGTAIDVIRLPLKLLKHYSLRKLGKRSIFSCKKEVERLKEKQKEAGAALVKLGIERFYQDEENWSVYEIGTMMPFYFS